MTKQKTLKQALPEYLKHLEEIGKSKSTRYTVNLDINLLMAYLGEEKELKKILPVHIAGFFKSEPATKTHGKPRSKATILQIRRITRQFLIWMHEKGYVDRVPLTKDEMKIAKKKLNASAEQSEDTGNNSAQTGEE